MGLPRLRALDGAQAARIWLAVEATDMRCGFDRLAERVQAVIGENPLSGHLFVFRSRRGDRLKILAWDRDGFVLWYKRLEKGVFKLPTPRRNAQHGVAGQRVGHGTGRDRCFEAAARGALRTRGVKKSSRAPQRQKKKAKDKTKNNLLS